MPYISEELRKQLDDKIYQLIYVISEDTPIEDVEGILNYTCTKIMLGAFQDRCNKLRYKHINAIMGVLTCMVQEMYRRMSWYEDLAMLKNGDLPELEEWGRWV